MAESGSPKFFKDKESFRRWMEKNHSRRPEQWIGYYKMDSGRKSITWPESVEVALCFGWIDGIRKSIDGISYKNRFTPRKKNSNWSAINIKKYKELLREGLVAPAGEAAFNPGKNRTNNYSFEQNKNIRLPEEYLKIFRKNKKAFAYFEKLPPGYRRLATWRVISAKRDETRMKRLNALIEDYMNGTFRRM
jgi:uncharacterized protein YdeI (YjbR/CyaY-like superfamily)